uniref:Uncharacterized protein n=1 Tax=Lygus hesperus TaxID=30085 RepID=A0A0A9VN18_LYGHE
MQPIIVQMLCYSSRHLYNCLHRQRRDAVAVVILTRSRVVTVLTCIVKLKQQWTNGKRSSKGDNKILSHQVATVTLGCSGLKSKLHWYTGIHACIQAVWQQVGIVALTSAKVGIKDDAMVTVTGLCIGA